MSKDKKNGKATKEVKKATKKSKATERENIATADYSKTTAALLATAKGCKGKVVAEQTKPGVLRIRLNDSPILRITGLTKELPTVYIRPKLRSAENGKEARAKFTELTGITSKNWKRVGGGSGAYFYDGDNRDAMLLGVKKYCSRAHKIVSQE